VVGSLAGRNATEALDCRSALFDDAWIGGIERHPEGPAVAPPPEVTVPEVDAQKVGVRLSR
jgi:hypothetical protein